MIHRKVAGRAYKCQCLCPLPKTTKKGKGYVYCLLMNDILKIGTTNNVKRRIYEHLANYQQDFKLLWVSPQISEFTALRVERDNKETFKKKWEYIPKDRFVLPKNTKKINIKIRKTYSFEWD